MCTCHHQLTHRATRDVQLRTRNFTITMRFTSALGMSAHERVCVCRMTNGHFIAVRSDVNRTTSESDVSAHHPPSQTRTSRQKIEECSSRGQWQWPPPRTGGEKEGLSEALYMARGPTGDPPPGPSKGGSISAEIKVVVGRLRLQPRHHGKLIPDCVWALVAVSAPMHPQSVTGPFTQPPPACSL